MIEIEIDNKKYRVEPGKMIIEVADQVGIRIPRFCYHKKLSVAANCRMCLVDVEKSGKPLPACATPITDGMIVRTCSAKAIDAQKSVMEFLLINHPLDCPICDQGGECELQDVAMGYGSDISRFTEGKRSVKDKDLGSLVATDMTRCIQCTRCVRFGDEIAGLQELGTIGRGEHMKISTYVEKSLTSELSGNIIDLCPVGALTSKPFRFRARSWELEQSPSIAAHDCIGSHIYVQTLRKQQVMRVTPRENEAINETWLSDRDRFSYEGLNSDERLRSPMIKENGEWKTTDWATALEVAAYGIKNVVDKHGFQKVGALLSPSSTVEESFLLQKIMRGLGSHNIDHRLQQVDFAAQNVMQAYPGLSIPLDELERQETIVLVGSHITREQPIAAHRVRKATLQGNAVFAINPIDYPFHFAVAGKHIVKPSALPTALAEIVKVLIERGVELPKETTKQTLEALVGSVHPTHESIKLAERLHKEGKKIIILGAIAQNHPHASVIKSLAEIIGHMTHTHVGILTTGANAAGAWLAGAIPHRGIAMKNIVNPGMNTQQMLQAKLPAYVLFNVEPELDCANPAMARAAMEQAEFVIAVTPYFSVRVAAYANVFLPSVPFTETSGTFVNTEGKWQRFNGVVPPKGEARPGWKILRVLGNLLQLEQFEYQSSEEIHDEVKQAVDGILTQHHKTLHVPTKLPPIDSGIERIGEWPIYRIDSTVRRAPALQAIVINDAPAARMSVALANRLQLSAGDEVIVKEGQASTTLPVELAENMPDNTVAIPLGFSETATINNTFGVITLQRSDNLS